MKIALKRKQNSSNADWLRVFRNIEKYVSRTEVEAAADKTMSEMTCTLSEYRRPIYAYSGGKDSIVLADLCRNAGINVGVMAVTGMEYPTFERWLAKNLPQGVRTVSTGQTLDWLTMHPERFIFQSASGTDKQIPIKLECSINFMMRMVPMLSCLAGGRQTGTISALTVIFIRMEPGVLNTIR